jgi:hypothetical protein
VSLLPTHSDCASQSALQGDAIPSLTSYAVMRDMNLAPLAVATLPSYLTDRAILSPLLPLLFTISLLEELASRIFERMFSNSSGPGPSTQNAGFDAKCENLHPLEYERGERAQQKAHS